MSADTDAGKLLGDDYKNLYGDYYVDGTSEKREIAAVDTLSHLRQVIGAEKFGNVIDVGAGEGSLLGRLDAADFCEQLYAVEISESGLARIKSRNIGRLAEAQLFDGYKIPYPDKFFDLAISIHVLEHVEHERLLLRELRRVAHKLVIEVPLENHLRVGRSIAISGPYGHINFYTPQTFLNLLRTTGLKPLRHRVVASSLRYEQFIAGKSKGLLKFGFRRGVLAASPQIASKLLTYMFTVYCDA